ncbi:hypothetical protein [Roseixanthobacter liquoris]|uniref:hypothetical protein n=1 Tax=Roseixanthobacter liquoris TaxID=3119921 RepID=UPI003728EC5A
MTKIRVFEYGRYDIATDEIIAVHGQWATKEMIALLRADPIGPGMEVDEGSVFEGRLLQKSPEANGV